MNEFGEKIVNLLKKEGYTKVIPEHVAVYTDNVSDEARVSYNFMSTSIHLPKSTVSKEETEEAGFKWWPTWVFVSANNN